VDAVCADTVNAAQAAAKQINFADRILFALRFILKFTSVTDAELKLAAGPVMGIMVDGNAVVEPQRAEVRNIQPDAEAPIVIERS